MMKGGNENFENYLTEVSVDSKFPRKKLYYTEQAQHYKEMYNLN